MEQSKKYDYISLESKLCEKIEGNNDLRRKIKEDPKKCIEKELGISFADNTNVNVIDSTERQEVTFVLPANENDFKKHIKTHEACSGQCSTERGSAQSSGHSAQDQRKSWEQNQPRESQ